MPIAEKPSLNPTLVLVVAGLIDAALILGGFLKFRSTDDFMWLVGGCVAGGIIFTAGLVFFVAKRLNAAGGQNNASR